MRLYKLQRLYNTVDLSTDSTYHSINSTKYYVCLVNAGTKRARSHQITIIRKQLIDTGARRRQTDETAKVFLKFKFNK